MKTKKHLIALVVSLALVIVAVFGIVGCTDSAPKSYSFEGVLHAEGGKEMPAFLELKEDGGVKLEFIMTMGNPNATAHTLVTDKGSWTQSKDGVITSVKLESNGDTYDAGVSADGKTITIGYSLDYSTFTVSVAEVSSAGKNFEFSTTKAEE